MSDVKKLIMDEMDACEIYIYKPEFEEFITSVLEGMSIVPTVPTQHMINKSAYINDCFSDDPAQLNEDIYIAMINANKEQDNA